MKGENNSRLLRAAKSLSQCALCSDRCVCDFFSDGTELFYGQKLLYDAAAGVHPLYSECGDVDLHHVKLH